MVNIFLIHGLGCTPVTMLPLELHLRSMGFKNIYRPSYPISSKPTDEAMKILDENMTACLDGSTDPRSQPTILIGQSMGGVMSIRMHKFGWNVVYSMAIVAPLKGAYILKFFQSYLPEELTEKILEVRPAYTELLKMLDYPDQPPPHPYHTISVSWPFLNFDGCVFQDEACLDVENHIHIPWSDHRTVFLSPRLFAIMKDLLQKYVD